MQINKALAPIGLKITFDSAQEICPIDYPILRKINSHLDPHRTQKNQHKTKNIYFIFLSKSLKISTILFTFFLF